MFAPSQQPPDRGQTAGVRNPFLPFGVANQTLVSLVSNVLNEVQPVSANWPEQDCIFADVGEYLVKCSEALAETAEKLVNHNHLMYQLHQSQQQQQWGRENFGYNSFYLPHKHESLKNLAAHLRANYETLRVEWSKSEHPPHSHHQQSNQRNAAGMAPAYGQEHPQQQQQHHQQHHQQQHQQHQQQHHQRLPTMAPTAVPVSSVVSAPTSSQHQQHQQHQQTPVSAGLGPASATAAGPVTTLPRRDTPNPRGFAQNQYGQQQPPPPQQQPQQQQQQNQTPASYNSDPVYPLSSTASAGQMEPMDDEISALDEERVRQLLSQPQHRGVGQHYCPLHERCDKGGVAPDGTIRLFERNSDFRTHLKKHVKMYKCPVPGCKNVEGFGRKDQLERHIRTTKHGPSAGTGQSQPQAGPQLTAPPVEFRY